MGIISEIWSLPKLQGRPQIMISLNQNFQFIKLDTHATTTVFRIRTYGLGKLREN